MMADTKRALNLSFHDDFILQMRLQSAALGQDISTFVEKCVRCCLSKPDFPSHAILRRASGGFQEKKER